MAYIDDMTERKQKDFFNVVYVYSFRAHNGFIRAHLIISNWLCFVCLIFEPSIFALLFVLCLINTMSVTPRARP